MNERSIAQNKYELKVVKKYTQKLQEQIYFISVVQIS